MKRPWIKFYPSDWRADPCLRMCSIAARGLWIDLISYMHEGEPYGHLTIHGMKPSIEDIASLVASSKIEVIKALAELERRQVCSRTHDGVIYSRRMVRDSHKAMVDHENGLDGGNPEIRRGTVPKEKRVRPFKRSDAPEKTLRIFEREGGKCHWCSVHLTMHPGAPGEALPANYFHVDHVIAICDGGTNDEDNLVAACASCNHKRARDPTPTAKDSGGYGRNFSDNKAQKLDTRGQRPEKEETRASALGSDWPPDFAEQFWGAFPNKVGRKAAIDKLERIGKTRRVSFEELMAGLHGYVTKTDDRPWCNPLTWLNQERWTDQPAAQNGAKNGQPQAVSPLIAAADALVERARQRVAELSGKNLFCDDESPPFAGSISEG